MGIGNKIEEEFDSLKEEMDKLKMENYELTRMMFDISYKLCQNDIEIVKRNFPELVKKLFNMRIEHLKGTFVNVFFCSLIDNYYLLDNIVENYTEQYGSKTENKALKKIGEIKNRIETLLSNCPNIDSDEFKNDWQKLMYEGEFATKAYSRWEVCKLSKDINYLLPY